MRSLTFLPPQAVRREYWDPHSILLRGHIQMSLFSLSGPLCWFEPFVHPTSSNDDNIVSFPCIFALIITTHLWRREMSGFPAAARLTLLRSSKQHPPLVVLFVSFARKNLTRKTKRPLNASSSCTRGLSDNKCRNPGAEAMKDVPASVLWTGIPVSKTERER